MRQTCISPFLEGVMCIERDSTQVIPLASLEGTSSVELVNNRSYNVESNFPFKNWYAELDQS